MQLMRVMEFIRSKHNSEPEQNNTRGGWDELRQVQFAGQEAGDSDGAVLLEQTIEIAPTAELTTNEA